MRKLITLICLLSCFFSASLSAQCETDIVITNIECEDNFWTFYFEVQVDNPIPGSGIIYPNDPTIYPFNFPVVVTLPINSGLTEIVLTYVGLTGCEGESFFVVEPECPTDPGTDCMSVDVLGVACEDNGPGFSVLLNVTSLNTAAVGWTLPGSDPTTIYPFGENVTLIELNTEIEIVPFGDPDCTTPFLLTVDNPCGNCPLEIEGTVLNEPDCGESNGLALFQTAGTTGDFQISYSGDNGHSGSVVNENFINGLQTGCYTFELSDDTDMCSALTNLCFEAQAEMIITFITILDDCEEVSYRVDVNGGTPPYFFEWSDGLNGDLTGPLVSGLYSLTVIRS